MGALRGQGVPAFREPALNDLGCRGIHERDRLWWSSTDAEENGRDDGKDQLHDGPGCRVTFRAFRLWPDRLSLHGGCGGSGLDP